MDMSAVARAADQGLHSVLNELYNSPNMSREQERASLLGNVHSLCAELATQRQAFTQLKQRAAILDRTTGQLEGVVRGHFAEKEALLAEISKLASQRDTLSSHERDLRMDKDVYLTEIAALRSQLDAFRCQRDSVPAAELTKTIMVPRLAKAVSDPTSLAGLHVVDSFRSMELGQWVSPIHLSVRDSLSREYTPEEMAVIKRRMQTDRGRNRRSSCDGDASLAGEDSSNTPSRALMSLDNSNTPLREREEAAPHRFSPEVGCPPLASVDEGDNGSTANHALTSRSSSSWLHSFVQSQGDADATHLDSTASESPGDGGASEDSETETEEDVPSPVCQLESATTAGVTVALPDTQPANPVDEDMNLGSLREVQVGDVPPKPMNAAPIEHQTVLSGSVLPTVKIEHGSHVGTAYGNAVTTEDPETAPVQRCTAIQDSRAAGVPCLPGTAALNAEESALTPGEADAVAFTSRRDVSLLSVKDEEIPASTAEPFPSEAAQVAPLSSPSQPSCRFSHRLYWRDESCTATRNSDVYDSLEDSDKASSNTSRETDEERMATDATEGEDTDGSVNLEVSSVCDTPESWRDSYLHVTYCSWCNVRRDESQAVALCAQCPRMCCSDCLLGFGEKVPRAGCVLLPAGKCLCLRWDSQFPKPPDDIQPEDHLLQQLVAHDLSLLFREEVDSSENPGYIGVITREEMMDLSTMENKMSKIQYRTTRGRRMFRKDLKQIWLNCWKYAGFAPGSDAPVPGIVSCTLILEAMVDKFYKSYIEEPSLAADEDSWQFLDERNKQQEFTRMVHGMPPRLEQGQSRVDAVEPFVVAAETCDDPGEETETDDEAEMGDIDRRRGDVQGGCDDTRGHKRKLPDEVTVAAGVQDSFGDDVRSQPTHDAKGGDGGEKETGIASRVNEEVLSRRASDRLSKSLCYMADVGEDLAVDFDDV